MQDPRHDEENHVRNYTGEDAVARLKALAEAARIAMFTTFTKERPMPARPMALQCVEKDGTLLFFSTASSDTNRELTADPDVQLYFCNQGSSEYLSVYGKAYISQDREKIRELWSPWVKTWFPEGPDDPDLTLITVKPESTVYWDTQHNKMVQLLKMAASMVTGKTMDDGVEGKLRI